MEAKTWKGVCCISGSDFPAETVDLQMSFMNNGHSTRVFCSLSLSETKDVLESFPLIPFLSCRDEKSRLILGWALSSTDNGYRLIGCKKQLRRRKVNLHLNQVFHHYQTYSLNLPALYKIVDTVSEKMHEKTVARTLTSSKGSSSVASNNHESKPSIYIWQ